MSAGLAPFAALLAIGAAWGLTVPLAKVAVSTGHGPMGLIAWELAIGTACLGALRLAASRRRDRTSPAPRHLPLFLVVALTGTILPGFFSYQAAFHLPAGVMAIVIAVVPMFALPIALALALERPQARRFLGLLLGLAAIVMIALPDTSLPDPDKAIWVLIALIAPACYGVEGNFVAWRGTGGLGPADVILGASALGLVIAVPLAVATGQWIDPLAAWGRAEWALVALSVLHVGAYTGYIRLVGQSGSVFASQVSYLVTGTGVLWSMALLGERYSGWIWAALALMLAGLAFVRPRPAPAR